MAELDNLSIVISASAKEAEKAIGRLTESLRGLEKAMNVGSLNTFVARLNNLTKTANSMNTASLKDLAKAMKDLSNAGKGLMNFGQAANQMGKVSNQAQTMADKLSREWGIKGSKNVNSLAMAIENMYSAAGNDAEVGKALSVVERLIKEYARVGSQADDTQKKIREMVSAASIYVPPTMRQEWGDDYKSKLGTLGIKNTTTDPTKGVDVQTFVSELRGMYGDFIPDTNNVEDTLSKLVEYLQNGSQSVLTYKEAINQGAISTDYLDDSLNTLAESVGTTATSAFETLSQAIMNGSVAMDDVKNKMNEITSAGASASAFSGVISSLESLQGLTIPDFTNLVTLKESISKIGGEAGGRAGQSLKDIAAGLRSFQGVTIPVLPGIDALTQQLRAIGSGTVVNAGKALPEVAKGLTMLKGVGAVSVNGLDQLASSLSMFGRKSAQDAVVIIPQLSRAFREMIDTLSNAPNISQKVIDLANAMANLSANMKSMPAATQRAGKALNLWHGHAQKAQKASFNLAAAIGKLYAKYWMFMRVGRWFGSSMKLASDLVEVQNVVDNTFGDMKDKMEDFAKTSVDTLGMSELTVKTIASRFQAMGKNMGVPNEAIQSTNEFLQATTKMGDGSGRVYAGMADSMADVSLNLTKLAGDMASFYNLDYNDVAKKLEAVFTGQTRPLRTFGLDLTQATLQEFALRNGLNANIKTMSQYEKMLLRYQYVMANTTAAHGDFERTINTWANQIRIAQERLIQLKKILGTIGVNVFKPLVRGFNDAMNTIIHLAESTLNALGKIFGWKVEIADVGTLADDSEDFADNMDDAAGSAKKMKDYMLGIDELNVFNADDGKGGGGGGVSGGGDAAIEPSVKWEETEKGYESIYDTLFKLGKRIGEVEKQWLQNIDWDGIYAKAEKFGKGLASFLNGYLSDAELFYEKGRLVANALNVIGHALKAFSEEFDGYQLGVDIGSWINGLTQNIDWTLLNKAAYELAHDIAETINGAVNTTNWDMVGSTIAKGLNVAIRFASTLVKETDFNALGQAVGKAFNGLIQNFNAKELAETIRLAIHGAVEFASTALATTDFEALGRKVGEFLRELKLGEYVADIARLIGNILIAALKLVPSLLVEAPLESALLIAVAGWKFTHVGTSIGGNLATAIKTGLSTSGLADKLSYVLTADMGKVWGNATLGRKVSMIGMGIGGSIVAGVVGFNLGKGIAYIIADITNDAEMKDIILHLGERWGEVFEDGFVKGVKQIGAGISEIFKKEVQIDDSIYGSVGDAISAGLYEKLDKTQADARKTWGDVLKDIQEGVTKLDQEDFAALKESMLNSNINAVDAIRLVGQLEAAQKSYYEDFPAWLENETLLKNAVDTGAITKQYAYQEYVKSKNAKTEEAAATDALTTATEKSTEAVSSQSEEYEKLIEQLNKGEISQDEYYQRLTEVTEGTDRLTESTKKTGYALAGVPSYLTDVVGAMNESSDATLSAEEESTKFQELWNNYTISNVDISQLHEINEVLTDINTTSDGLVTTLEANFGKIFSGLETKLGDAKTTITTFDEELNTLLTTLFDETIPTDFENTTEGLTTFLETTSGSIDTFDEELGKRIDALFDETLPTKFEDTETALTGSLGNVETAIGETIGKVQKKFEEFLKWFDKNILEKTKGEYWTKALSGVSGAFETTFRGVANGIATIMNTLIEQINASMNVKWDNLVVNGQTVLAAGEAKLLTITPIPMYERGGFPEDGLFYANHNEMVGGFTNGRTAVANNEMIVDGIRNGVQAAMSDVVFNMLNPYLSDIAQSSRETANKDFSVNIGDRDIAMANNRGQSLVGMTIIS